MNRRTLSWIPALLLAALAATPPLAAQAHAVAGPVLDPIPAPADVAAPPADAQRSKSGLAWKVLKPGTGTTHPKATSTVRVHYTGWTTDGKMFDSSLAKGTPSTFELNKVVAGWTEGLQMMTEGE